MRVGGSAAQCGGVGGKGRKVVRVGNVAVCRCVCSVCGGVGREDGRGWSSMR